MFQGSMVFVKEDSLRVFINGIVVVVTSELLTWSPLKLAAKMFTFAPWLTFQYRDLLWITFTLWVTSRRPERSLAGKESRVSTIDMTNQQVRYCTSWSN